MNIVIDIGNSRVKAATFELDQLQESMLFHSLDGLQQMLAQRFFENSLISSVNDLTQEKELVINVTDKTLLLTHHLPLPINLKYETPETLGMDRIAAACGALTIFPERDCLVIDMGTCVNYEFIDAKKNYYGGAISPGMDMRFKAMHTFTARLPLVKLNPKAQLIGNSTERCMQSGVLYGMVGEIEGMIQQYQHIYPQLMVILCGGDASFFENKLKPTIFASPDLVLMGLNRILSHNASL